MQKAIYQAIPCKLMLYLKKFSLQGSFFSKRYTFCLYWRFPKDVLQCCSLQSFWWQKNAKQLYLWIPLWIMESVFYLWNKIWSWKKCYMKCGVFFFFSNTALPITFLSYDTPFTGKHEPNELTCSQLCDFLAQLVRALHRHHKGHGFESRWVTWIFRFMRQLLKLSSKCEDHIFILKFVQSVDVYLISFYRIAR